MEEVKENTGDLVAVLIVLAARYVQGNNPVFGGFGRALLIWLLAFLQSIKE